jgi:hypothetical protein
VDCIVGDVGPRKKIGEISIKLRALNWNVKVTQTVALRGKRFALFLLLPRCIRQRKSKNINGRVQLRIGYIRIPSKDSRFSLQFCLPLEKCLSGRQFSGSFVSVWHRIAD